MKAVYCLCLFVALGTADWLDKRDGPEDNPAYWGPACRTDCRHMYGPIDLIMDEGSTLNRLVRDEDDHLALNCSTSSLSAARRCVDGPDISVCLRSFSVRVLYAVWDYFCQKKSEVESLNSCWNNLSLEDTFIACFPRNYTGSGEDYWTTIPTCAGNAVSAREECGDNAGRLVETLFEKIRDASVNQNV